MYATFESNDMNGRYTPPFSFFGRAIAIGRPCGIAARNRIPGFSGERRFESRPRLSVDHQPPDESERRPSGEHWYISYGSVKTSVKLRFLVFVRTLFFALPALAIATSGYAQEPAPSEHSTPPSNRAPIRAKLVPAQSVAAAETPVGTPSESPSPPVAPPRNAGPVGQPVPDQDTVIRLQIFLDEHSFGPGKIDGRWGEFIGKALQRFQAANGQQPSGQIDSALQQELQKISPVYTTYTLTDGDLNWVGKVPSKPAAMARLKRILYRSALDYVAERYHADPAFIRKLNSGRNLDDLKKGSTVQVPNVQPFQIETIQPVPDLPPRPEFAQRIIRVDTRGRMLDLVDANRSSLLFR